ncbi:hypothetical protein CFC21_050987 [Triticum aestivum]|uniref:Uncharacterized protein n=4 Tax=Triticum TaxID=4564 RepID=A0A9R0S3W0_TRITD|nr:hypothetical protein TRIUR3_15013 [Triticum urartu]KAF7041159.1 hypothetical protein CFC21_050987 [Triticum aestivum]VAH87296.1 unnamed protein product [Triticum turgidum subsp. durum]
MVVSQYMAAAPGDWMRVSCESSRRARRPLRWLKNPVRPCRITSAVPSLQLDSVDGPTSRRSTKQSSPSTCFSPACSAVEKMDAIITGSRPCMCMDKIDIQFETTS